MKDLSKLPISDTINLYIEGDNSAGDYILKKYDTLIKRACREYFYNRQDPMLGFGIDDAFQMARLKILDELKRYDIERCNFPSYIVIDSYRACSRLVRYARAQKRDYTRQAELDAPEYREEVAHIEDATVKLPEQTAIENELMGKVEARIAGLDAVCQAVYQVAMDGRERIYNSRHPLLANWGNSSTQLKLEKVRAAVKGVLED